jgi:hypothetical protein
MPPGRKPADPNIRIAKTWTGSRPTPINGPIARALKEEIEARRLEEQLAALRAAMAEEKG